MTVSNEELCISYFRLQYVVHIHPKSNPIMNTSLQHHARRDELEDVQASLRHCLPLDIILVDNSFGFDLHVNVYSSQIT